MLQKFSVGKNKLATDYEICSMLILMQKCYGFLQWIPPLQSIGVKSTAQSACNVTYVDLNAESQQICGHTLRVLIAMFFLGPVDASSYSLSLVNEAQYLLVNTASILHLNQQVPLR